MLHFFQMLCAIAVVAHEPGYVTSLSKHIARWLNGEGIAASVVTPAAMPKAISGGRIAFLVGFAKPTERDMSVLRQYRANGGKLVVFHSASPELGALMGVRPLGYASAPYPGAWSRMRFDPKALSGCPADILQTSTVLNRIAPMKGRGRVAATWLDRAGKSTGDAAWVATDAGWWMSHVLLADGDEDLKARMLGAMCAAADPRLWSAAKSAAKASSRAAAIGEYARAQRPRAGEIHAVWEHSGCGLYPGNWKRTMAILAESHVTDLFVNVAGAGFAHYPSQVLPRSRIAQQEGDQLAAVLKAANGTGIRVHAWMLCFTATRAEASVLKEYARRGWRMKDSGGRLTDYLDPARPEVRALVLSAIGEMQARYPSLSGIHLDFVRYDSRCARPKNAVSTVSGFVAEARRRVARPRWLTVAVLGKYPSCVASVGQDWAGWLDLRLVDYVVPMDYTDSAATFETYVAQHGSLRSQSRRIIAGIGVTANESRLDARQVIGQVNLTRKYALAGNALFDLDVTLEKRILPYLRMGAW